MKPTIEECCLHCQYSEVIEYPFEVVDCTIWHPYGCKAVELDHKCELSEEDYKLRAFNEN